MGQNPRTFGTHQDAIAGYVQQKSCRIWDFGGYRRGNPLLHAHIAMIEIGTMLQLVGGFKGGHNWITNPNNASTMGKSLKMTANSHCFFVAWKARFRHFVRGKSGIKMLKMFQPFFPASFQSDLTAHHHLPVWQLYQCQWRCPWWACTSSFLATQWHTWGTSQLAFRISSTILEDGPRAQVTYRFQAKLVGKLILKGFSSHQLNNVQPFFIA